jgi:hypothetical protein
LDLIGQRGRDAVRIDGGVVEAFRLEKNLMAVAVAEADDLVLNRRAVTRTAALDLAGIHRRSMHVGADDFMRCGRRPCDGATDLPVRNAFREHRERLRRIVAGLHLERRPVDRHAVEPGRGTGLKAPKGKTRTLQGH